MNFGGANASFKEIPSLFQFLDLSSRGGFLNSDGDDDDDDDDVHVYV